ncbi:hypothetical protein [Pseudonocardia spirodelae]|uniref:Uncharacterized protein n=1 Tax=Pseudonocardia spirodelae TaxID=3133431 RepID=A0ABU8T6A2_9PSEU
MDTHTLVTTRRGLHAVAEHLLAGPQERAHGTIHLRVSDGGFAPVHGPWRVEGAELVGGGGRVPLTGTLADVAAAAGIAGPAVPGGYDTHADWPAGRPLEIDPAAAATLAGWFARGDAALDAFAPYADRVLWPEHFDLGLVRDEVNYGVSPGDAGHPEPYAYVGPWAPRSGPFWNAPFGALRPAADLPDVAALTAFLLAGRDAAIRPRRARR